MRIAKDQTIAGMTAPTARALVRVFGVPHVAGCAGEYLKIDDQDASTKLAALHNAGYLRKYATGADGEVFWVTTTAGNALAQASLAKPITRKTAERLLSEVLERTRQYNADPAKLYAISKVRVFGSYLDPEQSRLGDLDVAVEIVRRVGDEEWIERSQEYVETSGRSFKSFVDRLSWPHTELVRYVRGKSAAVSVTDEDPTALTERHSCVYDIINDKNAIQPR